MTHRDLVLGTAEMPQSPPAEPCVTVCATVIKCGLLWFAVDRDHCGGMPCPSGFVSLPLSCAGQAMRCPLGQTFLHRCHAARFRPRGQHSVRSATTFKKHQVQAEEGPLNGYRLPSVKKQAAEHRQRVLSKLGSSGMLFIKVRVTEC